MTVKDLHGNEYHARLTTGHAASSYGQMVMVLEDGQAIGHFDVAGLALVEATDEERADLARAGYSFREE